jgi:hypothetical protein
MPTLLGLIQTLNWTPRIEVLAEILIWFGELVACDQKTQCRGTESDSANPWRRAAEDEVGQGAKAIADFARMKFGLEITVLEFVPNESAHGRNLTT